jgi:hypothetical protein
MKLPHGWSMGLFAGLLCASASLPGCGNSKSKGASGDSGPVITTGSSAPIPHAEDHAAEVKAALEEALTAAGTDDAERFSKWFQAMLVPNYEAWCKQTFGAEGGAKLARSLESPREHEKFLRNSFATIYKMQATEVRVFLDEDRETLAAMKERFPLYTARFYLKGESRPSFSWEGFAFVEGRARWIGEVSYLK